MCVLYLGGPDALCLCHRITCSLFLKFFESSQTVTQPHLMPNKIKKENLDEILELIFFEKLCSAGQTE